MSDEEENQDDKKENLNSAKIDIKKTQLVTSIRVYFSKQWHNVTLKNALGELFILPIAASFRWTSPYGWREDPIAKVRSFHTGVDMACPKGTPIPASQSGRVVTVGLNRVYGNYIIIDHGNGYKTLYAHMSKTIAKKGAWVNQGAKIGLVGTTGYSTGPHLHFTVYKNNERINPMTVLK